MMLTEYLGKWPLKKLVYSRSDVEKIRKHAFMVGQPETKDTRSDRQRKYQWGVVYKLMATHTGYESEEIHQLMAKMFLSYENKGEVFVRSTAELNTKEMEIYLENVRRFASMELSVNIPLPNETEFPYEMEAEK